MTKYFYSTLEFLPKHNITNNLNQKSKQILVVLNIIQSFEHITLNYIFFIIILFLYEDITYESKHKYLLRFINFTILLYEL